jgi:hypothetical protein
MQQYKVGREEYRVLIRRVEVERRVIRVLQQLKQRVVMERMVQVNFVVREVEVEEVYRGQRLGMVQMEVQGVLVEVEVEVVDVLHQPQQREVLGVLEVVER